MCRLSSLFIVLVALIMLACNHSSGDIEEPLPAMSDEEKWMEYVCSSAHMGRKAGTMGCDSVAAYIQRELFKMGYYVNYQDFRLKDSLDLKNIFVEIDGESDSILVIGAHYDGAKMGKKYPAADDNGSGVVTLLSLCKYYSDVTNRPKKTVLAGFWAAEEVTIGAAFNGSKYFVKNYDKMKRVQYYCNLDCFARKGQGTYFYYSRGLEHVGTIMSKIISLQDLDNIEFSVKENDKGSSDYMSFNALGIPYFGWNDYNTSAHIHSPDDSIELISFEKIYAVVNMTTKLVESL